MFKSNKLAILAALLSLLMLFSAFAVPAFAEDATTAEETTAAEKKMLERMGLTLVQKKETARPSYKQIEIFISYLENGLEMMEEFDLSNYFIIYKIFFVKINL